MSYDDALLKAEERIFSLRHSRAAAEGVSIADLLSMYNDRSSRMRAGQVDVWEPECVALKKVVGFFDDDEYVFGLLEAGATGYLLKTTGGDELIRSIHAVYKNEPALDPVIARKVIDRFRNHGKVRHDLKDVESLTEREMEILKLAANGMGNKDIADRLHLSRRTIEGILRTVFNKMGVSSRVEAITQALRKGWFTLEEIPQFSNRR
jgi:DNA-binding CsgD family transcriptional regulator